MNTPSAEFDIACMRRAVVLAMRGRGFVEPNPMVGCVIAKAGRIIGEGFHERFGQPHAEPNALTNCAESPAGATAYVTLEPCCHTNKQTPPCVPRLIAAGVSRVVVGCLDPNPQVSGGGAKQLREAGVIVEPSQLESSCKQLLAPFFARQVLRRPYVTLKWAESADGKVGLPSKPVTISNEQSLRTVHELRARCDAIAVGIGTVLSDDPMLTARGVKSSRALTRVVFDRSLRTPIDSKLARTATESPVIVYSTNAQISAQTNRASALTAAGATIQAVEGMEEALVDLHARGVTHLLIEPGPILAAGLFATPRLIDRLWVFRSPRRIGEHGVAAAAIPSSFQVVGETGIHGDRLKEHLNTAADAFFAAEPSADFVRTMGRPTME